MTELCGLILTGSSSDEDDLAYRLQGRSRYAMPLANRILVRYAAEALVGCGVTSVAVAVSPSTLGEVGELLGDGKRFGARFRYLELSEAATAADALRAARQELGDHALVVHQGDALVTGGLRGPVGEFTRGDHGVILISEPSHSYPEAVLAGVRGTPHRDEPLNGLDHVAPAAVVSARVLADLDGFAADSTTIGGTMAALAESGVTVSGRALDGCWCYSGDSDDLLEANRMILDGLTHSPPEMELDSVRIEGRVAIHPSARIERTTIRGPAVIGGGAEIIDTFIGPYSSIGPGARLDGAEVEHSIVLERACIRHVGQRIEASVIGAEAEIDHDFGVPSAVRLQVGRRSSVTLS